MSSTLRVPLRDLCVQDRSIVAPDADEAAGLRYVGLEHIESGSGRIAEPVSGTGNAADVASATFRFGPEHVLYSKLRPYLNKVALPNFHGRCTTEVIPLLPTPLVTRDYLAFLLRSEIAVNAAQRTAVGSRMPRADIDELFRQEFSVPSPLSQAVIVSRLQASMAQIQHAQMEIASQLTSADRLPNALLREYFGEAAPLAVGGSKRINSRLTWAPLLDSCRLESGHTPSRRRPEWWGGDVPWLALPDIRKLHGKFAYETIENTNDTGLKNSSARLLPVGTVCVSRTASIGFVTLLGKPMATSQDFCNWVCDPQTLDAEFLMYAFMASQQHLRELGSGAVHKTIYMPTIQSFHLCAPALDEQRRIARRLRDRLAAAEALSTHLRERQAEIAQLPRRLLAAAFEPGA